MKIGVVTGAVWATRKCATLAGQALLVTRFDGGTLVAADLVGAGVGDTVLIAHGSSIHGLANPPADAAIVAILDQGEIPDVNQ